MRSWLESKRGQSRLLGTVLLAAALGTGCGSALGEETPAAQASEALGTASDSSHSMELERLIAGLDGDLKREQHEAFRCDPEPEVTHVQVCDETVPSRMRFEWTECSRAPFRRPSEGGPMQDGQWTPPPPPVGQEGMGPMRGGGHPPPGDAAPTSSSGTVELINDITVAPEGTCGPETRLDSLQSATFSTKHTRPDGSVVTFQGTTTSKGNRLVSETTFTRTGTLDTTREVRDAEGNVVRSLHLSGTLSVTFDGSGEAPVRILSGKFDAALADGTSSVITVEELRRTRGCRWPIAGTVVQTQADGTEHVLGFGPECGSATLDGEAYELRGGHHGREGRDGGRPAGPGPSMGSR